ncbi:hypothetical protein FACS1894103_3740 [Campylobacterota bacterium]|nr:hypothetical protein FACS1894103_3740 [Campylobacterota bacterium]
MNVSSVVIKTLPEHLKSVIIDIQKIDGVDVHFCDERGMVIATIEAECVSDEIRILGMIEKTDHIISANMNYAYAEDELEAEKALITAQMGKVPEVLREQKVRAEDMQYGGNVNYLIPKP